MSNFPILAVMALFMGAFINSLTGRRSRRVGNIVVFIAMAIALCLMLALIPPVFIEGQVITYWMGGWAPEAGWAYGIGLEVDALSLFFGLIVTIAVMVSGVYSFTYMAKDDSQVNFYTLFLMLSGSVLGLVLSGDLFNIFVMVEIMTFSAVALTAFRNDYEGALEGAFKYLVVGSIGSMCILVGTALIYANLHTLNMAQMAAMLPTQHNTVLVLAFGFLFVGFATKAFLFPFQPLAADAHAVAPASISLMISGVLTKCGVYGIIRLCYGLFQNIDTAAVQYLVTGFGCVTMFVCVTMAFNQHNFKRLLAFHSISQVGYVITAVGLGSALGVSAGLFHAVNHTLFKGLLFLVAGAVQHETGSLDLDGLGGLSKKMPRTCLLFLVGAASISGLPPFNGFASKWMIYQACFAKAGESGNFFYVLVCVVALITSVLTLASFVKVAQSVFYGQLPARYNDVHDCPAAMRAPIWVLAALCALLGVFPGFITRFFLKPATGAALDATAYADQMLGGSHAASAADFQLLGNWSPLVWVVLLLVVCCAVTIVAVSAKKGMAPVLEPAPLAPTDREDVCVAPENAKYEPFFSGEESEYSQVGGSDLFWGFKENWRKYFSFWHRWHSGIVNDYALYGVVALAAVLLYCLLFV
ncbi:MAG: proton-conducting transporter membrane subunit [Gemmiger sp.]|nr:proton-conducting transporter membrane subunit [Gemmiger sp.]